MTDESRTPDSKTADESGNNQNTKDIKALQEELNSLREELVKTTKIKEKLVAEQEKKNKKHSALRDEKLTLEQQIQKLSESNIQLTEKLENLSIDFEKVNNYKERAEAEKKAELEALLEKIPEDKKGLLEYVSDEDKMDHIRKNAQLFFGKKADSTALFTIPKPENKGPQPVFLTPAETAFISGKMTRDAALEIKAGDPTYFERLMKN